MLRYLAIPAALCALAIAAPSASALSCGATITKDTTLTGDVTNCPGVGLRIGADDITLDLGGHTVAAAAKRNPTAHGIFNKGHKNVTIRGGTVRGFGAYGVRLAQADRNLVENMNLVENFTGIGLVESDRGTVRKLEISGAKFVGINLSGGALNTASDNHIVNGNGAGISIQSSTNEPARRHRILNNRLEGNGIVVQAGPQGIRLIGNTITGAPNDGIAVFEPSTVLQGNTATGNHGRGIFTPNGLVDGGGNQASANGLA